MRIAVMVTLAATLTASALAQTHVAGNNNKVVSGSNNRVGADEGVIPGTVEACSPIKRDASGFTECEALKLGYLTSLEAPYQLKLQTMDDDRLKFIDSLSPNYPGKTYQEPTKDYPIGRLVDKVAAPVAPVAPVAPKAAAPVRIDTPTKK